jgi:hypothetical protein
MAIPSTVKRLYRLTPEALKSLGEVSQARGLGPSKTIETLIREAAVRELPKEGRE